MTPASNDVRHDTEPLGFTAAGAQFTYIWNCRSDLSEIDDDTVYVRFQVYNGTNNSILRTSPAFSLDLLAPRDITNFQITPLTNALLLTWENPLIIGAVPGLVTNTLFGHNFESPDDHLNDYDVTNYCMVDNTGQINGNTIQIGGTAVASELRKNIDTIGYSNIRFSYNYLENVDMMSETQIDI